MAIKSFEECIKMVESLIPKTLISNEDFYALIKLLAYSLMKNYEEFDRIDNAYSVDYVDIRELPKLADTIGIVYPIGADQEILRLLLKYYGKIIKNRGTIDSIKQMVRILEFKEEQLYSMSLSDYTDVEVKVEEDGFILVKFDGVTDFDYAYRMLRKVVPAGCRFEVMNKNGPIAKAFDKAIISESHSIEEIWGDYAIVSENVSIEK